jgi:hypothetical protein
MVPLVCHARTLGLLVCLLGERLLVPVRGLWASRWKPTRRGDAAKPSRSDVADRHGRAGVRLTTDQSSGSPLSARSHNSAGSVEDPTGPLRMDGMHCKMSKMLDDDKSETDFDCCGGLVEVAWSLSRSTRRSFRSRKGTPMRCDGRRGALCDVTSSPLRVTDEVSWDKGHLSVISMRIGCSVAVTLHSGHC